MRKISSRKTIKVIETSIPKIFTSTDLDTNLELQTYASEMKELFDSSVKYIHPMEFNYQLPNKGKVEYAFVGRSNVGKSSLISSLLGDNKLVRISKEPGCTKSINYFTFLRDKNNSFDHLFYLVDLPGIDIFFIYMYI